MSAAKAEEESLLEEVKQVLGLRQIICICPSSDHVKVAAAARRLLLYAKQIQASNVRLAGKLQASLTISLCTVVTLLLETT